MTPEQLDRVFGCGRLQMVTGKHVEVFREAAAAGTRRRYTKRFLHTREADFGQWTEREWRILARLIGHGIACVPDVVQYDRGTPGGTRLVQTYDAGATVDQWATILPVRRNGRTLQHMFEDCAHWWALAHHCLRALQAIHELSVVHLDLKGDNVCIPVGPPGFDPHGTDLHIFPRFGDLALIDFAFALVSGESLTTALPIGWQTDYDYQSPRLLQALEAGRGGDLQPTRQLDWRCDMYSLGAMLKRYLPDDEVVRDSTQPGVWSAARVQAAKELILALRDAHDGEATLRLPHARLLELTAARIADADTAASLAAGWTLARDANVTPVAASPATPVTRLAPQLRVMVTPRVSVEPRETPVVVRRRPPRPPLRARRGSGRLRAAAAVLALVTIAIAVAAPNYADRWTTVDALGRTLANVARAGIERLQLRVTPPARVAMSEPVTPTPPTRAPVAPRVDAPASNAVASGPAQADAPASNATATGAAQAAVLPSNADAGEAAQADAPASNADAGSAARRAASDAESPTITPVPGRERRSEPPPLSRDSQTSSTRVRTTTAPVAAAPALPPLPPVAVAARVKSGQGAKIAVVPSRPPMLANVPSRPNTYSTSKIATAMPSNRSKFFEGEPTRSAPSPASVAPVATLAASTGEKAAAAAAPPAQVAIEPAAAVPAAAPAAAIALAAATTSAQMVPVPVPVPVPASRPKAGPPAVNERRGIFSVLTDFALRRDHGMAPIEDRTVPSTSAPPGSRSNAAANVPPKTTDSARSETIHSIAPVAATTNVNEPPAPALAPADVVRMPAGAPQGNETRPAPRELAPRFALQVAPPTRDTYRESETDAPDLAERARHTLAESVPYAAARAQGEVARVLRVAANAGHPAQGGNIVDAVRRGWPSYQIATSVPNISPANARQLNEEARHAYVVQRNVRQAFDLQLRAFGANPRDAEIAGNLAFLFLKANPTQAETARQLSLHAIALRSSQMGEARVDDWSTLAIASALTRREADATNALYVAVALSRDLDRDCKVALDAVDRYGDIMMAPVQAMMLRIHRHGRNGESRYCAWPMNLRMARGNS